MRGISLCSDKVDKYLLSSCTRSLWVLTPSRWRRSSSCCFFFWMGFWLALGRRERRGGWGAWRRGEKVRVRGCGKEREKERERERERDVPVSFFSLHVFFALQFFHKVSLLLLLAELLLFSSSAWLFLWWCYSALLLRHLLHLLLLARTLALLHLRVGNVVAVERSSHVGFSSVLSLSLSLSRPRWSKKASGHCRRRRIVAVSSSSSSFCRCLLRSSL